MFTPTEFGKMAFIATNSILNRRNFHQLLSNVFTLEHADESSRTGFNSTFVNNRLLVLDLSFLQQLAQLPFRCRKFINPSEDDETFHSGVLHDQVEQQTWALFRGQVFVVVLADLATKSDSCIRVKALKNSVQSLP